MTELLSMSQPQTREQQQYIKSIMVSCTHLLTIINDILDFSKIEYVPDSSNNSTGYSFSPCLCVFRSGQMQLYPVPIRVQDCIEQAIALVYSEKHAHLDVSYDIHDDVPPVVFADVTRLRQVIVNLLSNVRTRFPPLLLHSD